MSKRELDNINNQIILPRRIMYQLSTTYTKKRNEIAQLQNQIQALQSQSSGLSCNQGQQQEVQNESYT